MWHRKASPSASYWFNRSWQTCTYCSFWSYMSIHGTHFVGTLQYSNVVIIISNALKPIFSSVHRSLVISHPFTRMSWWRDSSLCGAQLCVAIWNATCPSRHCCHCWNTPPTASLCSHPLFALHRHSASISECQFYFFFSWRNIMTYLSFMSMSDTILSNSRVLSFNLSNCLICWSFLQSWISQKQSEKQSSRVNYYVLKAWAYAQTLLFSKVDPWVFGTPDASASHSLSLNISLCITKQAYSVF